MNSSVIKQVILELGADIAGIAPAERFTGAPEGFHPKDIYKDCNSVLVFAKRIPRGIMLTGNPVPYTHTNNVVTAIVDKMTIDLCNKLEDMGLGCVPIPSDDPYEHWEEERQYGRAILSMRHAGLMAGLGKLGKNGLLLNDKLGNMMQLGAVLIDKELPGDPMAHYNPCPDNCSLCIDNCPQDALREPSTNQKRCRLLSNHVNKKGYNIKKCRICREICPSRNGILHKS